MKSIEIKAMLELAKRISKAEYVQKERIMSSERLARKMMLELSDQKQEHLVAIYLDTQNRIIEQRTILLVQFVVQLLNHVKFCIMLVKTWQLQ